MTGDVDRRHLSRALELAGRGWGRVHPNPMVGAVVVRDGEVVGEGWHAGFGGPHGEAVALDAAGERARGATLYVTLEPCSHHGKTPPCTDAIVSAGVVRVVYSASDPNPVAAGGAAALEEAGVRVAGGLLADEARRLNAAFHHAVEQESPWLALKLAVSLDSRIARVPGERTSISGTEAGAWVHWLRAGFDAVMVGSRTAAVDDPRLTVRGDIVPPRPPIRVVVDSAAALRLDSGLVRTATEVPVRVIAGRGAPEAATNALEDAGVRVLRVDESGQGIDVREGVRSLWRQGVRSILCEGGGRLAGSLLEAGLVRRIYLIVAPVVLGREGVSAFPAGMGGGWQVIEARPLGRDGLLVLEPTSGSGR